MNRKRVAAVIAGTVAGTAASVALSKAAGRRARRRPDPERSERLSELPFEVVEAAERTACSR